MTPAESIADVIEVMAERMHWQPGEPFEAYQTAVANRKDEVQS